MCPFKTTTQLYHKTDQAEISMNRGENKEALSFFQVIAELLWNFKSSPV